MNKKSVAKLLSGPVLFALCMLLIPESVLPFAVRGTLGLFLWMSAWWITIPVGVAVTAFLPIVVCSIFGIVPVKEVIPQYFTDLVVLLLGADILTKSWETTGLNKRIALFVLRLVGPSMKSQLIMWFVGSTIMSIFLPNVVVAACLMPIAISMLNAVGNNDASKSTAAANIFLAVAWGSGLGGFGSPLGGGMNLIIINQVQELTGQEFMYTTWVKLMLPILIVLTIVDVIYMCLMKSDMKSLPGAKDYFVEEYRKLGKMSKEETLSLWLFVIPVVLAFTRELWKGIIPAWTASYVFLPFAVLSFCLPGSCNGRLITWKWAQPKISWGLFYTLAGGLALDKVVVSSGSSAMIAEFVQNSGITSTSVLCILFIILGSVLANISSNNSACAIVTPLVVSVMSALGQNPIPYLFMAAVGGNLAYLLPSATRAVAVDAGVEPSYMLKKGALINIITLVVACVCALICLKIPMYINW